MAKLFAWLYPSVPIFRVFEYFFADPVKAVPILYDKLNGIVISRQNGEWQQAKEGQKKREVSDGMHGYHPIVKRSVFEAVSLDIPSKNMTNNQTLIYKKEGEIVKV